MKVIFKDNKLLKNIIELFKDAVGSANFKFTPNGITMQAMDSSHISMASFTLSTDVFALYECHHTVDLGIDLANLFKVLKVVTNKDDVIGLETIQQDRLSVQIKNSKTEKEYVFDLKLIDIDVEELEIPPTPDGWQVSIDASEFLKNVTIMTDFCDTIEIGCSDGKMYFMAKGDMADAMASTGADCKWVGDDATKSNVVLKFSSMLIKQYGSGKQITDKVNFVVAPEHPILIQYKITDNSYVEMFIAPKMEE